MFRLTRARHITKKEIREIKRLFTGLDLLMQNALLDLDKSSSYEHSDHLDHFYERFLLKMNKAYSFIHEAKVVIEQCQHSFEEEQR